MSVDIDRRNSRSRQRAVARQKALSVLARRYADEYEALYAEALTASGYDRQTERRYPIALIVARYSAGASSTAIAREVNCSPATVLKMLRRAGEPIRSAGAQPGNTNSTKKEKAS